MFQKVPLEYFPGLLGLSGSQKMISMFKVKNVIRFFISLCFASEKK